MAVPKKRTGHSAQGHRRSNWKATKPEITNCTKCGEVALTHTVCTACGYYKGKAVSIKSPDYVETVPEPKKPAKKAAAKTKTKKAAEEQTVKQEPEEIKTEEVKTEAVKEVKSKTAEKVKSEISEAAEKTEE